MDVTASYQSPRGWLRISKYLLPVGMSNIGWRKSRPPQEQVPIARLAADYPDAVTLHSAGIAEALPEFEFACQSGGSLEQQVLPGRIVAPAYVGLLRNAMSFGRHCCAIGPDGKAVRETGFNLDGAVVNARTPISPLRFQYWRKRWEGDVTSRPWLPSRQRIDGRVALLNTRFSHNFYHWMIDILPRLAPLQRVGLEADYYLVDCLTPFQQKVFEALGIGPHQLIQPHCRLLLEADELIVPSLPTPTCLRDFGQMLLSGLNADGAVKSPRRIFISRRRTGTRTLANEAEVEQLLRANHFETHCMEQYPLAMQARLIHEADIVVGTHGAGLANLIFARPGTRVIEIVPARRYNFTIYPEKSRIFGLDHRIVFAESARHKQILRVAIDGLAAALEWAERPSYRVQIA